MKRCTLLVFLAFAALLLGEVRELVLLQTADTHASLFQETDGAPCWPRLATLIRREIASVPNGGYLLIDCGDAVQGSMAATLSDGMAGFAPLLALPYDVIVPGNHELDFGRQNYRRFCELAGDRLLAGNFYLPEQPRPGSYKIFERNGVKVAVIGMQASFYRNWLMKDDAEQCHIEKAVPVIRRVLPEILSKRPDVIVLATHQGWLQGSDKRGVNEVNEIANTFPEIDIILGAHTHRIFPGRKIGLKAWYVQPGANGEFLGVLRVKVDTDAHEVLDIQSSLKAVRSDIAEDEGMLRALRPYRERWLKECARDTGITLLVDVSAKGRPGVDCEMSALISQAIAESAGAEVVFHSVLSGYSLRAGKVSASDLHKVVPYENKIVTAMVTAEQLEQIMNEQWAARASYRFNGPWNAVFRQEKGRLVLVEVCGRAPENGRLYKMALNSHAAAGSGTSPILRGILDKPEAKLGFGRQNTRDALEAYLRGHCGNLRIRASWIVK